MPHHKHKTKISATGQASLEYLLALTAVFLAFAGVGLIFRDQMERYLTFLFDWIASPL